MSATDQQHTSSSDNPSYNMGHKPIVTESHASRTVHSDAAFILPHIKPGMHILDVGCGPGTITVGFLNYVPQGSVTGTDYSEDVLKQARERAERTNLEDLQSGRLTYVQGDLYKGLPFEDNTFDLVFSSQVFTHLITRPVEALKEVRRVCKSGGMVASREGDTFHWYPAIDGIELFEKGLHRMTGSEDTGRKLHVFARQAGFEPSRMTVGTGTSCIADEAGRRWWGELHAKRLEESEMRPSWLKGGMTEEECDKTIRALREWAHTEDGWYCLLQSENIYRK